MLRKNVIPVVGLPQSLGWSQVIDFGLPTKAHCVIVYSVAGNNASNFGRDIAEMWQDAKPVTTEALYLTAQKTEQLAKENQLEICFTAGIFAPTRTSLVALNSSVLLKRKDKVGTVISAENILKVMEGEGTTEDIYFLLTTAVKDYLGQIEQQLKAGYDPDSIITTLVPAIHRLNDSSLFALASVEEAEEEVVPPIEVELSFGKNDRFPVNENLSEDELVSQTSQVEKPAKEKRKRFLNLGIKIKNFLNSKKSKIAQIFSKKEYVGGPSKKKILIRFLSVLLIIGLLVGLIYFYFARIDRQRAQAEAQIAPLQTRMAQAQELVVDDPLTARERAEAIITEATTLIDSAENEVAERVYQEALTQMQADFQEISGRDEFSELEIFYDVRTLVSDFVTSLAASSANTAVFIDTEKKLLVVLTLSSKQASQISLESVGAIKDVKVINDESAIVLADGLYTINFAEQTVEQVKPEGDSNREGVFVGSFGSFRYVFNPEKRNIYRYAPSEDTELSDPIGWLVDPLGVPYEDVVSFTIDGDIWIGSTTGEIRKFASGSNEEFTISGLPQPLTSPVQLITQEDSENLYVLEPAQNRVVIIAKDGTFLREITSTALAAANSFLVSEQEAKILPISGSTVFQIDL